MMIRLIILMLTANFMTACSDMSPSDGDFDVDAYFEEKSADTGSNYVAQSNSMPVVIDGTSFNPPPAIMRTSARNLSSRNKPYRHIIKRASQEFGIEEELIHAITSQESNYRRTVVSSANAKGLMQLIPATGKRMGCTQLFNAECNVRAGTRYIKTVIEHTGSNHLQTIASGYNAGEGVAKSFLTGVPTANQNKNPLGRQTPNGVPPDWWGKGETYNYARKVAGYYLEYKRNPALIGKAPTPDDDYFPSSEMARREAL